VRIIVGISGASGAVYGWELLKFLNSQGHEIHGVVTTNGWKVLEHECGVTVSDVEKHVTCLHALDNLGAAIASGSFKTDAMVVAPCSMRTVAAIAHGLADNLLCRAADVVIKEKRRLVLVPRETPFSSIHLENMLKLSNLGVTIMPASPGYYHRPTGIEDLVKIMVGRIADAIGVENELFVRWSGEM
jgi:4-hydroxy-3-polyprenylbenzoate decarboxylase